MRQHAKGAWFVTAVLGVVVVGACRGASDTQPLATAPERTSVADAGANVVENRSDDPSGARFDWPGKAYSCEDIAIEPGNSIVAVEAGGSGSPVPVPFRALAKGTTLAAEWTVDREELGTIDRASGAFVPRGNLGGSARIQARIGSCTVETSVSLELRISQNGAGAGEAGGGGAGGYGGVGGEGVGPAGAQDDVTALQGEATAPASLSWLYPYANTVFPRGTMAPLLQWRHATGAGLIRAIRIRLDSPTFHFDGTFTRPASLAAGADFVRHPIPQDVWRRALLSTEGTSLRVNVTVRAGAQVMALPELPLIVTKGDLKGTVYYSSYGTKLVENYGGALPTPTRRFGAATLSIRPGETGPRVTVGFTSSQQGEGCRGCHVVSPSGNRLFTMHFAPSQSADVATLSGSGVSIASIPGDGRAVQFAAPYPDGSMALSDGVLGIEGRSSLFAVSASGAAASATQLVSSGLPSNFTAATPSFSPDGKHVAFTFYAGTSTDAAGVSRSGDRRSLAVMDFNAADRSFSNLRVLYTPPNVAHYAAWPAFVPTSDAIVFEVVTRHNGRDWGGTRSDGDTNAPLNRGARAELWYVDLATATARPLRGMNGKTAAGESYLPKGPDCHGETGGTHPCPDAPGDDTTLNYEPSVSPIVSGGYAWVLFTSRRLYGNVASINPWHSDPRNRDLTATVPTKKLWVAALKIDPKPDEDPSHPAFYLPAQELLAGNARGYWVPDPCRGDGTSCETGDECCGGFCRPGGAGGALVCQPKPPACANEFEACTTSADCCGNSTGITCVNNRCGTVVR